MNQFGILVIMKSTGPEKNVRVCLISLEMGVSGQPRTSRVLSSSLALWCMKSFYTFPRQRGKGKFPHKISLGQSWPSQVDDTNFVTALPAGLHKETAPPKGLCLPFLLLPQHSDGRPWEDHGSDVHPSHGEVCVL